MNSLPANFLGWLEKELKKLPELPDDDPRYDAPSSREASHWTPTQIEDEWVKQTGTAAPPDLNAALLEGWEKDPRFAELKIRPAKYPSLDLQRLWGHEDVIPPLPRASNRQRKEGLATKFDGEAAAGASCVFLSHSMLDDGFVRRVRDSLIECNLRPWLGEEQIEDGDPIFERVRAGLQESQATMVLLGRYALGSAWVQTEAVAPNRHGFPLVVCDGEDEQLMALLATWTPGDGKTACCCDERLLAPLAAAYRRKFYSTEQGRAALAEALGGESVRLLRPEKYCGVARFLLGQLGAADDRYVHGAKLPNKHFMPFADAVKACSRSQ